jgi:glycosyltransferase involved in cell wall biosynthesis
MNYIVFFLACIAAHRIWNFEEIFTPLRTRLLRRKHWWTKPVLCHACNPFWIAVLLAALQLTVEEQWVEGLFLALAAYVPMRASLWVYQNIERVFKVATPRVEAPTPKAPSKPAPVVATEVFEKLAAPTEPPAQEKGCSACAKKKAAIVEEQTKAQGYEKRIVLLTALSYFPPAYSVSTVVFDQARMLARNPKWLVQIWVMEGTKLDSLPPLPENIVVRAIVPNVAWKEDVIDVGAVERLALAVRSNLFPLGNATIITHDLLFISHYLTFAAAIHAIGQTKAFAWLHVCHSAAAKERPDGEARKYRATLPAGHRLLCLNGADSLFLAEYYDVDIRRVSVAANARDITTFGAVDPMAATIIDENALTDADVVQIFPVSGTRMGAKGVPTIIRILGQIIKKGLKAKLVLVNAHSNSGAVRATLDAYKEHADKEGLGAENLIITSERFPHTQAEGLSVQAVHDLFAVSNLFILPSLSEASSLVMLEAALSGCLIVSNSSLHTVRNISDWSMSFPFGSLRDPGDKSDPALVAQTILDELQTSRVNRGKRTVLRHRSYRTIAEQLVEAVDVTPPV